MGGGGRVQGLAWGVFEGWAGGGLTGGEGGCTSPTTTACIPQGYGVWRCVFNSSTFPSCRKMVLKVVLQPPSPPAALRPD